MTTNKEWLFSLPLEEQIAWMESEHYEPNPDCSAMLYKMYTESMKHEPCSHYEPKDDVDSRERLEADIGLFIADYMPTEDSPQMFSMICSFIDRQAAITERETTKRHELFCETCEAESDKQIAKLTAERDKETKKREQAFLHMNELIAKNGELSKRINELTAELENWKANCEGWKKDCERYRKKFGKCLDYADAIYALMDEGMA